MNSDIIPAVSSLHDLFLHPIEMWFDHNVPGETILVGGLQDSVGPVQFKPVFQDVWDNILN